MQYFISFASFKLMKHFEPQVEKLSLLLINTLKKNDFFKLTGKENSVRGKIKEVVLENIKEEEALDREVKRLMEAYADQIDRGEIDSRKAFGMIKAKLAKEKGVIL